MKRKTQLILFIIFTVGAILSFINMKTIKLSSWPYADRKVINEELELYLFKDNKVYINGSEVGQYQRFINTLTINFHTEFKGTKKVSGLIKSKWEIILDYPKKQSKLFINKG